MENGRSMLALMILCHWLLRDDMVHPPLIANALWPLMKKSAVCSNASKLKAEINRHWNVICAVTPELVKVPTRPNQWALLVHKWLYDSPISTEHGREFLLAVVDERIVAVEKVVTEKR